MREAQAFTSRETDQYPSTSGTILPILVFLDSFLFVFVFVGSRFHENSF